MARYTVLRQYIFSPTGKHHQEQIRDMLCFKTNAVGVQIITEKKYKKNMGLNRREKIINSKNGKKELGMDTERNEIHFMVKSIQTPAPLTRGVTFFILLPQSCKQTIL